MKTHPVEQGTAEWKALRAGRLTGSRAKDMLATVKTGEAAGRRDLRMLLVLERLTGQPQDSDYQNADMLWGAEHEAEARGAYEAATGNMVTLVGFCSHEVLLAGTSPDGFVGGDGAISIKCPRSANHLRYLTEGVEPKEHIAQNTHEMWLTGRSWIDFVSYDPRFPEGPLRLFCVHVTRTDAQLDEYGVKVRAFLAEVDNELAAVKTIANPAAQMRASLRVPA